jgi:hypothetical protein
MSLLTIVNAAQAMLNLPVSATVIGNPGQAQKQLLALSNLDGKMTADEFAWQRLIRETSFTTVATEEQTDASADLPADLGWIIDETLFNRNTTLKITGPLASREWQERKAFGVNVAWSQYRIRGNSFWFLPAPTAGESVYYEYVSSYFCESAGGTAQAAWTADSDVARIPENVMTLGLIWRWKAAKGMEHSGDYNNWVEAKERAAARSGSRRKLSAVGPTVPPRGGRGTIPEGNWP